MTCPLPAPAGDLPDVLTAQASPPFRSGVTIPFNGCGRKRRGPDPRRTPAEAKQAGQGRTEYIHINQVDGEKSRFGAESAETRCEKIWPIRRQET